MIEYLKKIPNRFKFLLAVILLYSGGLFFEYDFTKKAFTGFVGLFSEIAPIILFFFSIMFLVNIFIKPQSISKHFGKESGIHGWLYAVFGSVVVSGPPYMLYPLFGELRKQGMKESLIVAFLSNRNVQPAFVPVMVYYFGTLFTVVVSFYILMFSFINGFIAGRILDKK